MIEGKLELIEAKAGAIVDMGFSDSYSPPVVVRLAEETLELAAEVRRLQGRLEAVNKLSTEWDDMARGTTQFDAALRVCALKVREAVRGG